MFRRAESELDFENEKIDYRIVTDYEDAYRYNSPGGQRAPKVESFIDVNERNYKSESTKRERRDKAIRDMANNKNNHKDIGDEFKSIIGIIIAIIFFIIQIFF